MTVLGNYRSTREIMENKDGNRLEKCHPIVAVVERRETRGHVFHGGLYIGAAGRNARFYISRNDGSAGRNVKRIRGYRTLRCQSRFCHRRLNPLHRRIITTENIGRVGSSMAKCVNLSTYLFHRK